MVGNNSQPSFFRMFFLALSLSFPLSVSQTNSFLPGHRFSAGCAKPRKTVWAVCHKSVGLWHLRLPECLPEKDLFGHNQWHMSASDSTCSAIYLDTHTHKPNPHCKTNFNNFVEFCFLLYWFKGPYLGHLDYLYSKDWLKSFLTWSMTNAASK
jgi:hypothetical protein